MIASHHSKPQSLILSTQFDAATAPFDPHYYLEKLNDWISRYGAFISVKPTGVQEELSL